MTRAVYLDAAGEAVAGLHTAPTAPFTGTGVLLVPPLGWEDQASYRPRKYWAEALAGAGHAALRIDLPGTGDSEGGPYDPDRVAAWTAAIGAGAGWLRANNCQRVAVIALGLGGLLTLAAHADVDDAVLWGVPARGRAAVRELKAFGRLEQTQTGEDPADAPKGEVRAGGHVLSAQTAAALSAMDAAALIADGAPARVLLLGRDGNGPEEDVVTALRDAGATVETDPGRGWGAAVSEPHDAAVPYPIFTRVGEFLAAAAPGTGTPPDPPADATGELGDVRETPLWFDDGRAFGVLCEPADGRVVGSALLLNAGTIRHIGPSRMWTDTARRWARLGIATLRMDVTGVGEAGGGEHPYVDAANLHAPELPQQAVKALDLLAARGLPDRFLLAGMCSGAFWAFQAALADPRVVRTIGLNQRVLFFDPDAEPNRELRRFIRIFTPQGFRNMLIGDRRLLRLWRLVKWLAAWPLRRAAQRRNPPAPGDPLVDALQLLRDRGQRIDLAFSLEEPLHDELRANERLGDLAAMGVRMHDLPHISHTLRPVAAQRAASVLLDELAGQTFPVEAGV